MVTHKIYSLSNLQVYNTVLLIIVTMLYIRSSELIQLITKNLYPLNIYPFLPATGNHHSTVSMSSTFLGSTYNWDHTVFVFVCLTDLTYAGSNLVLFYYSSLCFEEKEETLKKRVLREKQGRVKVLQIPRISKA